MRFKTGEINFTRGLFHGFLIILMATIATAIILIPFSALAYGLVAAGVRAGPEPATMSGSFWTIVRWSLIAFLPLTIGLSARSQILQGRVAAN